MFKVKPSVLVLMMQLLGYGTQKMGKTSMLLEVSVWIPLFKLLFVICLHANVLEVSVYSTGILDYLVTCSSKLKH